MLKKEGWCDFLFSTYLGPFLESQGQISEATGRLIARLPVLTVVDGPAGKSQMVDAISDKLLNPKKQRLKGVLCLPLPCFSFIASK